MSPRRERLVVRRALPVINLTLSDLDAEGIALLSDAFARQDVLRYVFTELRINGPGSVSVRLVRGPD